jgi:type IV pilus assembly protein PilE
MLECNMKKYGFSLIELMIAVAVVGILAAIAVPSYQAYMTKTNRTEAQTSLVTLASSMESYYTENHTYATATINGLNGTNQTPNAYYTLSITNLTGSTYTLNATPNGGQATRDTLCQTLTLTQAGTKGIANGPSGAPTGTAADCWK